MENNIFKYFKVGLFQSTLSIFLKEETAIYDTDNYKLEDFLI